MPARYFSIPFANNAALIEVQKYLQTIFKEGAEWQDPATFHITLVYVPEVGEVNLGELATPANLPIFGVRGEIFHVFSEPGSQRYAVTVRVEPSPQLTYLQAAIAYEVLAQGVEISAYSYPGLYQPHVTLGYLDRNPDDYTPMPGVLALNVDRYVLQAEAYETVKEYPLLMQRAGVGVSEMAKIASDHWIVCEMKAGYPTVPTFSDVNIAELTSGDPKPFYLTLPIGQDNAISRNQRFYSAEFVKALERWVYEMRPIGNQGHIKDEDIDTAFPLPAGYWVGTLKQGDTLWGKAYVPPGDTREMARRIGAANGKLATSLHGIGSATWDSTRGAWDMSPSDFQLFSIDIAPAERAGIPSLARTPGITHEMVETPQEVIVDKLQIISELTAADVPALPETVKQAVLSSSPAVKVVSELQTLVGDGKDVVAEFKAMQALLKSQTEAQVETAVVAEIAKQVVPDAPNGNKAVEAVRQTVAQIVTRPGAVSGVEAAVKTVLEMEHIKTLIANTVVSEMGIQRRGADKQHGVVTDGEDPYFE